MEYWHPGILWCLCTDSKVVVPFVGLTTGSSTENYCFHLLDEVNITNNNFQYLSILSPSPSLMQAS